MKKYKVKIKGILEKSFYFITNSKEEAEEHALKTFENNWQQIELKNYCIVDSEEINF